MRTDNIKEIKIDETGRLRIYPEVERFSMIWRSAAEVHWDDEHFFLYSPTPREWSYYDWFRQITSVVEDEYHCKLCITTKTLFTNVPAEVWQQIILH